MAGRHHGVSSGHRSGERSAAETGDGRPTFRRTDCRTGAGWARDGHASDCREGTEERWCQLTEGSMNIE